MTSDTTTRRTTKDIETDLRAARDELSTATLATQELAGLVGASADAIAELETKVVAGERSVEKELAKLRVHADDLAMQHRVAERNRARTEPDRLARIAQLEVELAKARRRDELQDMQAQIDAGLEQKRGAQRRQIERAAALSQADAEVRAAEASFKRICEWAESVDGTSRADPLTAIAVAPDGATFARLASVAAHLGLRLRRDPVTQAFVADPIRN
jgi:hypothetical protein